jgi:hypothetical protein
MRQWIELVAQTGWLHSDTAIIARSPREIYVVYQPHVGTNLTSVCQFVDLTLADTSFTPQPCNALL